MAQLAREIAAVLGPHTQVEENGLFPAMAAEFPEKIAALEDEHRRIEAVPHRGSAGRGERTFLTDLDWPGRLIAALDLLRDHILKEQDGVFPAALAYLSTQQWEAIEAVRARVGTCMPQPST